MLDENHEHMHPNKERGILQHGGRTYIYNRQQQKMNQDYKSQIAQYEENIKENPNLASSYIALADFYIKERNDVDKVIQTYERAIPRAKYMSRSDNAKITYNLAIRYYNKSNFAKAREMFKESLKYEPKNKDAEIWLDSLK